MRINFFEEFPTNNNLKKAKLINFPSTIYLAASSLKEFWLLEKQLYKINAGLEAAYWPVLEKSYWISPFSYKNELKNLYKDLEKNNKKLKLLIDLELPLLNKKLFLINLFSFFRNKKLIKNIMKNARKFNLELFTAEYPITNKLLQKKLEWLGISYPFEKYHHKKIIMFYSSVIKSKILQNSIKKFIIKENIKYKDKVQVGLGTIAKGITGSELILSPKNLNKDLSFLKNNQIKEAVIFRLGGLNKEYLRVIKKYL